MMGTKLIPIFFIMVVLLGGEFVIVGSQTLAGCCGCGSCGGRCTCPGSGGCASCEAPTQAEDPIVKEKIKGISESFVAATNVLTDRFAASVRGSGGKFSFKVHDAGEGAVKNGCSENEDKTYLQGNIAFALADTGK